MHNPTEPADRPDLDVLYDAPAKRIQKNVLDHLIDFHFDYLKAATFFCLATGGARGLDASPRGGPPGLLHALDAHHVAFADWSVTTASNRCATWNRTSASACCSCFLAWISLCVNGRGRATTDPALLARLAESGKLPKTALLVAVDQVLFHCGKAINRAGLWKDAIQLDRRALPTPSQMVVAMNAAAEGKPADQTAALQLDAHYDHAMRHDLYG